MTSIFQIVKTAREYNEAIDAIIREHEDKGTIYSAYIPKLYSDYFSADRAIEYLKDRMSMQEKYEEAVDNYAYFCRECIEEIIVGLRDAHELTDFAHMEENLEGTKVCFQYLEIINKYWKNLL